MTPLGVGAGWRSPDSLRSYRAFGLTLGCDFHLPELPAAPDGPLDVRVMAGDISRSIPTVEEGIVFDFDGEPKYFGWPLLAQFELLPDNTILYEAAPGNEHLLAFPLLGPVLSVVLHRAGRLLLHSSAVGRNERTVFLLGDKGAGKSTTAAALVGAGFDLVTDDVLALTLREDAAPMAAPGFPQLKLAPQAVPLLSGVEHAELPGADKHRVRLMQAFSPAPRIVAAGCVLGRADVPSLRRLDAVASLKAVMRHSYMTRFARRVFDAEGLARHLRHSASLANSVPIYELNLPDDLDRLPAVAARLVSEALA